MATHNRPSQDINIGAADIFVRRYDNAGNPTGSWIYLGLTDGGTEVTYEVDEFDLTADQTGTIILDKVETGSKISVESRLLQTSKENILDIVYGAKENGEAVTFGRTIGTRASDTAFLLRIHPIFMGRGDFSQDIFIYQAHNSGGIEFAYKSDAMQVLPLKVTGFFDFSRENGDNLFRIGPDSGGSVDRMPEEITIAPRNPAAVQVGGVVNFSATGIFNDYTTANVTSLATWSTSGGDIVQGQLVGNQYRVTGLRPGTSIVNASYLGVSTNTAITIE